MGLKYFEQFENLRDIEDFKKFSLRESYRDNFKESIPYNKFKESLEKIISSYRDVILDYSIDIKEEVFIQFDIEIKLKDRLKDFYNTFNKLLIDEFYYILGYTDGERIYKEKLDYDIFKSNKFIRLFLDKKYDLPLELKKITYLYHVSTKENYEKVIKGNDISPKKDEMISFEPFPKIYLFDNRKDCLNFIKEKVYYYREKNEDIIDFVILKIDIKTMGKPTKIFKDRKEIEREGYYLIDPIPYWSITLDEHIDTKRKEFWS